MQDAEIKVEDLPQDILIKIMELLSPRQRLRAMCTCKALSESRYKMWTSIEINNVTTPQMPSVSAFLSRVGSQSGEILKHISLPSVYSWQIQSAVTGDSAFHQLQEYLCMQNWSKLRNLFCTIKMHLTSHMIKGLIVCKLAFRAPPYSSSEQRWLIWCMKGMTCNRATAWLHW